MTHEKYRPRKLDDALARIAEECSEVIKIVCKAQRFGLNDYHPAKLKRNIDLLVEELADVDTAKDNFLTILRDCQPGPTMTLRQLSEHSTPKPQEQSQGE